MTLLVVRWHIFAGQRLRRHRHMYIREAKSDSRVGKYIIGPIFKTWVIFRIKLDPTYSTTLDDAIPMFKSNNRYRDVIASPEGNTLYVLTDTAGMHKKMMVQSLIL